MLNLKISFNPKQKHLDEIAKWMVDEKELPISSNGNFSSIRDAFENKNLVVATSEGKTVGFYALWKCGLTISISVAETKPNYRKKGVGRFMLEEIIKKYEKKEIYAFYLRCSPESSQKIWKKLGFQYCPDNSKKNRSEIWMYKIIKPYLKPNRLNTKIGNETIEIWNDKSGNKNDESPTWIWNLKYIKNTRTLIKPIVHFGHVRWRIRWRKENETLKDCEYQYFNIKNELAACMIIKELPELKSKK